MTAPRDTVSTRDAPAAIGPYSQAVVAGGLVWCSGQIGLEPGTGELVGGGVAAQARRALENLVAVLEAAGSGPGHALFATVYLLDMRDFAAVNEVYAEVFGTALPARATVAVAGLPKGALVEVAVVARVP